MASDRFLLQDALLLYAQESTDNRSKIIAWRDAALDSIAEGNGSQIVSGSGNGLSYSMAVGKVTNGDWFAICQEVLNDINKPKARRGVSRAVFIA